MLKRKSLAELQQEDNKLEEVRPAKQSKAATALNSISEIINNMFGMGPTYGKSDIRITTKRWCR